MRIFIKTEPYDSLVYWISDTNNYKCTTLNNENYGEWFYSDATGPYLSAHPSRIEISIDEFNKAKLIGSFAFIRDKYV